MSTNVEESENVPSDFHEQNNSYAVYIFNINKHRITIEQKSSSDSSTTSSDSKQPDTDVSSVCLSLLETNLQAGQETIVRCHLLKTFSVNENAGFENEGKFVILNEDSKEFGCYYHHLVKDVPTNEEISLSDEESEKKSFKKISFFICLIGPANGVMESFCYEFGVLCFSLLPILDPQGQENCKDVQHKLQHWYSYCIEYAMRCIEKFKHNLVVLFQSALCGKIVVDCEDETECWDLTRFSEACSLNTLLQMNSSNMDFDSNTEHTDCASEDVIHITVTDNRLFSDKILTESSYCQMWVERLLSCGPYNHQSMRNILENFRLKTVQDLNTLKRLLKKAENDYYSLYRAFQFLRTSGYENILLHHVGQEALHSGNEEALSVIECLQDFINNESFELIG